MPTSECTILIMSICCSGYERLVQGRDLSPHLFFENVICSWSVVRVQESTSTGGYGTLGLKGGDPHPTSHVVGCTLHALDRPPPPRSLEINPVLTAIAHWKDVCIVAPSVIYNRSPSRHITPHTYQ